MPYRPPKPCTYPGCPKLSHTRRCDEHTRQERKEYDATRPSAPERGYGPAWRVKRAAFLTEHPNCEDCPAPATDVDHVPSRRLLVAMGVTDPDADQYLHARCHRCHSSKTAREDGRWKRRIWMPDDGPRAA